MPSRTLGRSSRASSEPPGQTDQAADPAQPVTNGTARKRDLFFFPREPGLVGQGLRASTLSHACAGFPATGHGAGVSREEPSGGWEMLSAGDGMLPVRLNGAESVRQPGR